jgi:5S rRNA maturation endonuclease (ribonuclease M5)
VVRKDRPTLICEGPTDTAAALTLGYFGLGRPSCSGGTPHIIQTIKRLGILQVAIIADNDGPGLAGAKMLMEHLNIACCILVLPCKDLREFIASGGNQKTLDCIIKGTLWQRAKW